jgi:hypothetical protein
MSHHRVNAPRTSADRRRIRCRVRARTIPGWDAGRSGNRVMVQCGHAVVVCRNSRRVNTFSVLSQFDETNKHIRHVRLDVGRSVGNIARAYALPELRSIFLTSFFFNVGFGFFISFFGVFLIHRFGFTEGQIGFFCVCRLVDHLHAARDDEGRCGAPDRAAGLARHALGGVGGDGGLYVRACLVVDLGHRTVCVDIQRPLNGKHGRAVEPVGRARGARGESGNWVEYSGARAVAAAARRRIHRGVTRAISPGPGRIIHDVPCMGHVRSVLSANTSRGPRRVVEP